MGDELGAVVETDVGRCASLGGEFVECGGDLIGVDGTIDFDREGFAGEFVDDVEELDLAAIRGGVELEVHGPHDVGADRAHRTDIGADAGETFFVAALRDP